MKYGALLLEKILTTAFDFTPKPELLYNLIQEIVIMIRSLQQEQIAVIIQTFLSQWNLLSVYQENNHKFVSSSIRSIIKEFYFDIFESECKRKEDNYSLFKEKYYDYFN